MLPFQYVLVLQVFSKLDAFEHHLYVIDRCSCDRSRLIRRFVRRYGFV